MYIFLDESKALHKNGGKFVLAGLVTSLKPSTIDKIYYDFLEHSGIKEKGGEIKSSDGNYRDRIDDFYMYIKSGKFADEVEFVGIYVKNYKENGKNYYISLKYLVEHTIKFNIINSNFEKINIIADNVKLDYKKEKIKSLLNNEDILQNIGKHKGFTFTFGNSKSNSGIKFADFVAGILRERYITGNYNKYRDFEDYCVNGEVRFIKIK